MQIPMYRHVLRGKMWNVPCLFYSILTRTIWEFWSLRLLSVLSCQSTPFDPKMRTVFLTPRAPIYGGPAEGLLTIALFARHRFLLILDM
jgi:hypothetical protein